MAIPNLPPFLQSYTTSSSQNPNPITASYQFSEKLGKSKTHCLWWPCRDSHPKTILLFIPGNPGLADFYSPYLSHIYNSSRSSLAILALSHIGLSSSVDSVPLAFSSLQAQVAGILESIDSLRTTYGSVFKLILIGHSVGAWIALQAFKETSSQVAGVFLLFPTIAHILNTPNGKRLSWIFKHPIPTVLSKLTNALRFIPKSVIKAALFSDWPSEQMSVLWSFLSSPSAVLTSLIMAGEEMRTIKDLNTQFLEEVRDKLYFFFATEDDWVGSNKELIMKALSGGARAIQIVHGRHGIPHAYCINHSEELGDQTLQWLHEENFNHTT